jgi:hypothetical protein
MKAALSLTQSRHCAIAAALWRRIRIAATSFADFRRLFFRIRTFVIMLDYSILRRFLSTARRDFREASHLLSALANDRTSLVFRKI